MFRSILTAGALAVLALSPSLSPAKTASGFSQHGVASHYANKFHGRKTANGERFNQNALTAAHKTLPMGTHVRVTRVASGDSVVVRINDRGPFVKGRVIDLSKRAAREIGLKGLAKVRVEVIGRPGSSGS